MRAIALAVLLLLSACNGAEDGDGRLSVVATFFPMAELARAVGGDDVRVHDLTPANAEPHDFEPGSDDVDRIEDADVLAYVGGGFQRAGERAARRTDAVRLDLLGGDDPHVWRGPVLMRDAVVEVGDALAEADPEHADAFRRRAGAFAEQLTTLDAEYAAALRTCERRVIVTTHDAFSRLVARYELRQESLTG